MSILGFSQNKHIAEGKARGKSTIVYDGKDIELQKKNCLKKYDENAFNPNRSLEILPYIMFR